MAIPSDSTIPGLFLVPPIGQVVELLNELEVEEQTITDIVTILTDSADDLDGGKPGGVGASHFGGSPLGAQLGHHTSIAHQHVVDAMSQMVAGLHGYVDNVRKFHEEILEGDSAGGARGQAISAKVETARSVAQIEPCTTAPDFSTNQNCSLPDGAP